MNDLNIAYWNDRHKKKGKVAVGHGGMDKDEFIEQTELFHGRIVKHIAEYVPARYNWFLFGLGELCILGSIGLMIFKTKRDAGNTHG